MTETLQIPGAHPGERWRPVPGHETRYAVSDYGRVFSLPRTIQRRGGSAQLSGRFVQCNRSGANKGCLTFQIHNNGRTRVKLHHLVMEVFVGPRPHGLAVLHADDNPANNCLANLRYGTRSDNMQDRRRNGNDPNARKTHCVRNHELVEPNLYFDRDGHRICKTCLRIRKEQYRRNRKSNGA